MSDRPEPAPQADNDDIYRGEILHPPPRSPSPDSLSGSSSSSSSFLASGRLGAIAAVVELAISRWARTRSQSPSSSSSSSVGSVTRSHSVRRRRRRFNSENLVSELEVSARIKARQESRNVPRDFTLYLPPPLNSGTFSSSRIFQTSSLSPLLDRLDSALKQSTKARRNQERGRTMKTAHRHDAEHHHYMLPLDIKAPSRAASFTELSPLRKQGKGKARATAQGTQSIATPKISLVENHKAPKAWWLDVASPTWEDMRAIGKLLHLHPLTLEDILHQDPREKLEIFPRLGYYLIVFRAIESRATQERFHQQYTEKNENNPNDEGIIREVNIYLVVFREGICSFHFADISEHVDRVRNRILLLEEMFHMSSDWIAHGILDSVVDSFTPFLEEIEKEAASMEDMVFSDEHCIALSCAGVIGSQSDLTAIDEKRGDDEKQSILVIDEKGSIHRRSMDAIHWRFPFSRTVASLLRRFRHCRAVVWASMVSALHIHVTPPASTTGTTLRRMARTRKLVTSLTRLLATKSEVVTQIRKRLLSTVDSGLGKGDDAEVAIYMGDVHDHILTLQYALAHYERMLSQSHPAYLFQLRATVSRTKNGTDKALMMLTTVSMAVLCLQTLIGLFSMNVPIPANGLEPGYPYNVFGTILAAAVVISVIFLSIVRRWWIKARKRRTTVL